MLFYVLFILGWVVNEKPIPLSSFAPPEEVKKGGSKRVWLAACGEVSSVRAFNNS